MATTFASRASRISKRFSAFIPLYWSRKTQELAFLNGICCCHILQKRDFHLPYSVIPKKFIIKKTREKEKRDNVYFKKHQTEPTYTFEEAIDIVKAYSLFEDEKIELIVNVNMGEGKNTIGVLKGIVNFPKPITKGQTVLVFAEGEDAEKARNAGASIVGGKELIIQVEQGKLEFEHCLSTLSFLKNISHLGKVLRDKMPNTRRGTATDDITGELHKYKYGEFYMAESSGLFRKHIALSSFTKDEIKSNIFHMLDILETHKTTATDKFYRTSSLCLPAGPKVNIKVPEIISRHSDTN